MFRHSASAALLAAASLGLVLTGSGCAKNPEAQFAWRDSTELLIPDARKTVQKTMHESFGTPHDLVAWARMPVQYGGLAPAAAATDDAAAGDAAPVDNGPFGHQLQLGRQVYMKNCLHCHGVAGDGAGPTARYLNPKPRDYRLGLFKFTSTLAPERITRDDLHRVVKYGIPGTYMPSFLLLDKPGTGDVNTKAVIEYVRWLAMRGEMEKRIDDELVDYSLASIDDEIAKAKNSYESAKASGEKADPPPSRSALTRKAAGDFKTYLAEDYADAVDGTADFIAENWIRADEEASLIVPKVARVTDNAASRERGRLLYMSDKTKCYTCHGHTGKGNGPATEDFWPKPGSTEKYANRGLHDVWGNKLSPRNLRQGQYRGGRRPVDVFRRIYAGIKTTPMPAFGGTVLKDEDIWDVVNYVMSLPYEPEVPSAGPAKAPRMAATEARQ
ncbi:MAG: cytochrome c [Planctomycetaceae bacterium]|nr:cytochrome c [Planctomycetaceae bacterium]